MSTIKVSQDNIVLEATIQIPDAELLERTEKAIDADFLLYCGIARHRPDIALKMLAALDHHRLEGILEACQIAKDAEEAEQNGSPSGLLN